RWISPLSPSPQRGRYSVSGYKRCSDFTTAGKREGESPPVGRLLGPARSGLMQAEKSGRVGRADEDAKDSAVGGDSVGDRLPEAGDDEAESAFHHKARVVGR